MAAFIVMHRRHIASSLVAPLAAIFMIALVAFSRVYLGVHFFSDVLASVAEGIAWLALCLTVINTYYARHTMP